MCDDELTLKLSKKLMSPKRQHEGRELVGSSGHDHNTP